MAIKPLYKIIIQTPKMSTELLLTKDAVTVGRSSENEVCVESVGISRKHLRIEIGEGGVNITDLNSTNGTIYQGHKLKPSLPVMYSGGVINLGPASDGNRIELVAETAMKEGTNTMSRAKLAEEAKAAMLKERDRQRELSRINPAPEADAPKAVAKEPSRVMEPSRVKEPEPAPKRPAYAQKSDVFTPPPVENIISRPVEEHILEGMREEIRRLREEQDEIEHARRDAEIKRNQLEDQSRQLITDIDEFESRLNAMREKTREEQDRLKRRLAEIADKLKTEEALFQTRRDELTYERDLLHRMERETVEKRETLEKEKSGIEAELEDLRAKHASEINEVRTAHVSETERLKAKYADEKDKMTLEHKVARRRLEDEHELLTERLKDEHDKLKKKLALEMASEKERCETESREARRKAEDEIAAARKKFDEDFLALKRKSEAESVAAQERYAEEAAAERRRIAEDVETDRKRLTKEKREYAEQVAAEKKQQSEDLAALKERIRTEREKLEADSQAEREKTEAETRAEIRRLADELADHVARTTQERAEMDTLHNAFVAKLKEDEAKLQREFDAGEKKHRIQLETLIAEIALKEAQEQKIIEQRRTEKLVAERELAETRGTLETAKKELAALHKNVVSVQEQLSEREKEERAMQESIRRHEGQIEKLRNEIGKHSDSAAEKREELAKLEAAVAAQRTQLQQELEKATREAKETVQKATRESQEMLQKATRETQEMLQKSVLEAQATKKAIIAQGQADVEAHRVRSEDALTKELAAVRAEAKARLEADLADWEMELSRRKARQTEEINLWFAEEKRKIQDRLSGDLDLFVDTVTSSAMAQMNQSSQFSSLIHEFHGKFSHELRHALTQPQEQFVAQFNPDRKKSTQTFWVKSAVAAVLLVAAGFLAKVAPEYIRQETERRLTSHDDASDVWVRNLKREREQRLALKLETRSEFQFTYADNVLYNEGYLEMKLDNALQSEWVKELNLLLTGEKAMGMDDEALVDYIRVEHALFVDLAEKKSKMNAINKDELIAQMQELSKRSLTELVKVLKTKTLPSSDKARQTTPEQKWRAIRELEQKFYSERVLSAQRRPAAK